MLKILTETLPLHHNAQKKLPIIRVVNKEITENISQGNQVIPPKLAKQKL